MEFDVLVKLAIYRHFAETGQRPSLDTLADKVGSDAETVIKAYKRLAAVPGL